MESPKSVLNSGTAPAAVIAADFLGGVKMRRGRKVLSGFATQKVVGLFCYLLDAGADPISREKLIAMFWAESPEDQARYNLRFALWNIRKVFNESEDDPDPLLSTRTVCQLNPEVGVKLDSHDFDRLIQSHNPADRPVDLMQAIELYKGPFLDGFALRNLPEWEEWLYHRREALHQGFLTAALEVGDYSLRTGQASLASNIFLKALSLAPDMEQAHEGLIRSYADLGRTSAAVRQLNIYTQVMKREFNAPPPPQIVRLVESLKDGSYQPTPPSRLDEFLPVVTIEPALTLSPTIALESPPPSQIPEELLPAPSGKPDVPFIGRRDELRDLKGLVAEVASGQGLVMIISSEMGIGKTRLFSEFVRSLPGDFILGIGESREIESTRPLEDLMQVLESIGRDPRLTEDTRRELGQLFVLQEKVIRQEEGNTELHLLEGIRRWIVSLAKQQPVLIALDDMHWAGEALTKVFSTLAQEVKRLPLLLIGIFRTYEENSEATVASALISIARTGRLRRIELGSLSFDDINEILRLKAPEVMEKLTPQEIQRVFQYSSGIPLYAIELASTLLEGQIDFIRSPALIDMPDFTPASERNLVPPLMLKITNFKLSQLAPDYLKLIKTASLVLGEFSVDFVQQILPIDRDALEDMLVELEDRNMLHNLDRGGRLSFAFNHQMIKLAIAETIPTLERQRLFRDILKAVEATGEPITHDARAYYLYNSGNRIEAIPALITSARFWMGYGDKHTALRYSKVAYQTALERLPEQPDQMLEVVMEHADNLIKHGLVKSGIDSLTKALDKLSSTGSSSEQSNLLSRRAEMTRMLKSEPSAPAVGRQHLAVVTAKRAIADVKILQGDLVEAARLIEEVESALENLPDSDDTLRATGLLFLVKARLFLATKESIRAIPLLESAIELLRSNGTHIEVGEAYRLMAQAQRAEKDFTKAEDALQNCYLMCQGEEETSGLMSYHREMGLLRFEQDSFEEAETHLSQALDICRANNRITFQLPDLLKEYASILTQRGDKEKARQMAKQAEETSQHLIEWNDIFGPSTPM
jgi:DNA-binding SARP family transcriptional activator